MSGQIKVSDTVQWWEIFKNLKCTPRMITGTVQSVHHGGSPWVGIVVTGQGKLNGTWVRRISELRLSPIAEATQTQADQESADLLAVHPDPSEILIEADILALMRWAGSGVER